MQSLGPSPMRRRFSCPLQPHGFGLSIWGAGFHSTVLGLGVQGPTPQLPPARKQQPGETAASRAIAQPTTSPEQATEIHNFS